MIEVLLSVFIVLVAWLLYVDTRILDEVRDVRVQVGYKADSLDVQNWFRNFQHFVEKQVSNLIKD